MKPTVQPKAPKPTGPERAAKPPPLTGPKPKVAAKDRAQLEALLRQADAKKAVSDALLTQNAQTSTRRLAWVAKRLAARYIDVMSLGLFGAGAWWAATEGAKGPESQTLPELWMLLFMACAVWFVAESLLVGLFGTTPGKYLLGLRIRDERNDAPGLARAFGRSFHLYARGLAFGLLFLTPFAIFIAGAQTLNKGEAPWDRGLIVDEQGASWSRRQSDCGVPRAHDGKRNPQRPLRPDSQCRSYLDGGRARRSQRRTVRVPVSTNRIIAPSLDG